MRKIILAFISLFIISCTSSSYLIVPEDAAYMIEQKNHVRSFNGETYSITVSDIHSSKKLHSIAVGKVTWKNYKEGDFLDLNYKVAK